MGRPDYIFGQFRETARCRDTEHGDGVCCAIALQLADFLSVHGGPQSRSSTSPFLVIDRLHRLIVYEAYASLASSAIFIIQLFYNYNYIKILYSAPPPTKWTGALNKESYA